MDFVFLADALALDFVNTEVITRGKRRDLLDTPAALGEWWRSAAAHYATTPIRINPDEVYLESAKSLRTALRRLFTAVSAGEKPHSNDLAAINARLQRGHFVLEAHDGGFSGDYRATYDDVLLTLALDAFHLLTTHDIRRIHHCKNDRCILLFYDTSKNATRRWCSWDCMNRARSIENYRKAKEDKK